MDPNAYNYDRRASAPGYASNNPNMHSTTSAYSRASTSGYYDAPQPSAGTSTTLPSYLRNSNAMESPRTRSMSSSANQSRSVAPQQYVPTVPSSQNAPYAPPQPNPVTALQSTSPQTTSASLSPIPFIQYLDNGKFLVTPEADRMLKKVTGRVGVVAVAGVYRTGKSYLLNQLAGRQSGRGGFQTGSTVNACTKGLWIWGEPISVTGSDGKPLQLLLLDTEGIASLERSEEANVQIFALALLLSSYFIYNSMHTIDESAIDRISLVAEVTKRIKRFATDREESPAALAEFFPSFLWLLRDFTLELVDKRGVPISPKQYLEHAITNQVGDSQRTIERNNIRETLRQVFPQRDCVTFVRPTQDEKDLRHMSEMPLSSLRPEFLHQLEEFKRTTMRQLRPKMINGQELNGSMLVTMAQSFVEAINQGAVPTIMSAWENVATLACHEAVEEARPIYINGIRRALEGGVMSMEQFERLHQDLMARALEKFNAKAIGMKKNEFEAKLKNDMMQEYNHVKVVIEKHAGENCSKILEELWMSLSSVEYNSSDMFASALKNLFSEYHNRTPNVPAKMEVLQRFLCGSFTDVISKYVKTHEHAAKTAIAKQKKMKDEFVELSEKLSRDITLGRQQMASSESRIQQLEGELGQLHQHIRHLQEANSQLSRQNEFEGERIRRERDMMMGEKATLEHELRDIHSTLFSTDNEINGLLSEAKNIRMRLLTQLGGQ
eukprot:TRINITY_DN14330_c0_g1_i1.p1 TRINITY_DN14330_c0_g1~~TRINITY_DN14330_c0_g1_i1.p1  ORF type:complete len:721 (+),score=146.17 TRINITY_DN14330_c0_g1_i1:51-2213(+)